MAFPADLMGQWQAADTKFGKLSISIDTKGVATGTWSGLLIPVQGSTVKAPDLKLAFGLAYYSQGDDSPGGGAAYITVTATGSVPSGLNPNTRQPFALKFTVTMSGFREVQNTTGMLTAGVLMIRDVPGLAHDVTPVHCAWRRTSPTQ